MGAYGAAIGVAIALAVVTFVLRAKGHAEAAIDASAMVISINYSIYD